MSAPAVRSVLVADDDALARHVVKRYLGEWGYTVIEAEDGETAWTHLERPGGPVLAVIDWMMPGLDGVEVCRRVRALTEGPSPYVILVTSREQREDIVAGLEAGADDYLVKPVHYAELRARIAVGERLLKLQHDLRARVGELESERAHVRQLQAIIPICASCKKIRDDAGAYHQMEAYVSQQTGAMFSHGLCPECEREAMRLLDASDPGAR